MQDNWRHVNSLSLAVILLGASLSLPVFLYPPPSFAAIAGANGKIVFSSSRDGNFEIYLMDPDGTNESRLTNNTANDRTPSWSPNGTKIAFARDNSIYVMNADGKNFKRIVTFEHGIGDLSWSPDGKYIVFSAVTDGTDRDIYVISTGGGRARDITKNATSDDFEPAWSPDGKRIAFVSATNSSDYDIFMMSASGNDRKLIASEGSNFHPSWSPDGTKLVFSSDRVRTFDIFTMAINGSNITRLTDSAAAELYPSWSPDGKKIVFSTSGSANSEQVYIMEADGSKQQRLTRNQFKDVSPEVRPLKEAVDEDLPILRENGKILYSTSRQGNFAEIYIMNADGTNSTDLFSSPDSEDALPKWSPKGDRLAYVSKRPGLEEIIIIDADGTNRTSVTISTAPITGLDWSPDGKKLVFAKGDPNHRWIHTINVDGTDQRRLTRFGEPDTDPSWSPDGDWIAFSRDEGEGNSEIYVMKKDGSSQKRITDHPSRDYHPQWSAEGDLIAFVTDRDGNDEIYVMNPDGKRARNLTNNTANDFFPSWSPDGTKIVFASDRHGDSLDIHVMEIEGLNVTRLTRDSSAESFPDFGALVETSYTPGEPPEVNEDGTVSRPLTILAPVLRAESSPPGSLQVGDSVIIASLVTSQSEDEQWNSTAILQVRDSSGMTQFVDTLEVSIRSGAQAEIAFRWTPEEPGSYEILLVIIDAGPDPLILADKTSARVTVEDRA
jgi:Tol biopolymer transport system component